MRVELWYRGKPVMKYPHTYRRRNFPVQLKTGVYEINIEVVDPATGG